MKKTELYHLTETIYAFPGDWDRLRPWVGIVITNEGTVLIDSGNGTIQATEIKAKLQQLNAPPVTHILLTHHHWDHIFGNCLFPNAHIVAHEQTQYHLRIMSQEPWSQEYIATKGKGHPIRQHVYRIMGNAIDDWELFHVISAHETMQTEYQLTLGGYQFTMQHVGGTHEPDQCIIHVQPGNVLFLGDATYGRGPKKKWDRPALIEAMNSFLARGAEWYVEGHRTPATHKRFAKRLERFVEGRL